MTGWLIAGYGVAGAAIAILTWLWRRAARDRDVAESQLGGVQTAAAEEHGRDQGVNDVARLDREGTLNVLDGLVAAHPELAGELLGLVVRELAAAASAPHAAVPAGPSAGDGGGHS